MADGANCTFNVAVWLGFNVSGKLTPEIVNPVPVIVAALMMTGAEPVDFKVRGCDAVVFTSTLPKAMLVAFTLSVAVPAYSVSAKLFVTPFAFAVSVAVCVSLTGDTAAVNPMLVALPGTRSEDRSVGKECRFR